jgi:predicted enzyme related to lactoylglutathione lyase
MGQPVVHFEVVGEDVEKLRSFYSGIAGWEFDTVEGGPTEYSTVAREKNVNAEGVGIGGGVGEVRRETRATSPSTSRFRTSAPRSIRSRSWVAPR